MPIASQANMNKTSIKLNLMLVLCPSLFRDSCELLLRRGPAGACRSSSCLCPAVKPYHNSDGRWPRIPAIATCFGPTHRRDLEVASGPQAGWIGFHAATPYSRLLAELHRDLPSPRAVSAVPLVPRRSVGTRQSGEAVEIGEESPNDRHRLAYDREAGRNGARREVDGR